ncbi:MAG: tandem-95 repeat protein [Sphingobacteriales bacterium]|nr:tandem-95 repeat protein [Sphingobacteriales bacterium]
MHIFKSSKRLISTILSITSLFVFSFSSTFADVQTFKKGSIIIDMGAVTPSVANSLKPYGLIYDLLKNYQTPVSCVINPTKVKDGIDFTHNGKNFRGGPFIIPEGFRTTAVNKVINTWKSQGVLIDSLVSDLALEVSYTMKFAPKWVMDATNGRVAVAYLTYAGIPASSYIFKGPSALNSCDDIYVMPHAAPQWNSHNNLYFWNKTNKGAIWAGCNAVSIMEGLYKDTVIGGVSQRLKMNFLSTNGLVNYANHSAVVTPLTQHNPSAPMAQYIGTSDAAQTGGAESIYMPAIGSAWNAGVTFITKAPNQTGIPSLSAGPASNNLYGRGFDDATRGYVCYQGSHSYSPSKTGAPSTAQIAAQRMFFNFSFFAIKDKLSGALTATLTNIPTIMYSGTTYTGLTVSTGGTNPAASYLWTSNVPGTFSNSTGTTTSFTPSVTASTDAIITCLVTDACGRTTFDTKGDIVVKPAGAAFTANAITQSIDAGCGVPTITFDVFDSNFDASAGARTLTNVTGFSNGSVSFTSAGSVVYTANANYTGTDNGSYTISNGILTATNTISITVGSVALAPVATTDAITVLEDSVTTINVLTNDKNNFSATTYNKLYIRDIITKPSKGYVNINTNGTLSYVTTKDLASGSTDQFTYLIVNDLGYTAIGTVNVTLVLETAASGKYKRGVDIAGVTSSTDYFSTSDNYIDKNSSSTNKGTSTSASLTSRTSKNKKSLLKFDLSSLPSSTTISSATLTLTTSSSYTYSSSEGPFPATIYRANQAWTETGSTWSNYKSSTAWPGSSGASTSGTDYTTANSSTITNTSDKSTGSTVTSNITAMAQAWITSSATNLGLLIVPLVSSTGNTRTYSFYSRENTTNNAYKPKLTVEYSTASVTFPEITIPTTYKPIAYPDTTSVKSNATKTINVRSNDLNYYGNTNNLTSVTTPAHGTASIVSGNVLYTPAGSYAGVDTFTYTITDATNSQTKTATVRVTVSRVAPTIVADNTSTNSNTAKTISVGLNDTDPQGSISSPTITTNPKFGSAVVSGSSIVYTPSAGFTGKDTLIYSRSSVSSNVCDAILSDTALVVITVVNQNPIATADTINTSLCLPKQVDLLANDSDPEGTLLTAVIVSNPSHGALRKISNGKYLYTPTSNYSGADQFTYKVKDGSVDSLQSSTATVSINVFPITSTNTAPIAVKDTDLTYINQNFDINVLQNDSDPESDSIGISISTPGLLAPAHGVITLLANKQINYNPTAYFSGVDSFEYKISDFHASCSGNTSLTAIAKVYVTVSAVPISVSGTIWSDLDNSANGTFNTIQTNTETGTNAFATLKLYLVDSTNYIIDQTSVDFTGNYTLVNVPRNINKLKIRVNSDSYNNGSTLSANALPATYSSTTPLFKQFNSASVDITAQDFGVNQLPSATSYTFAEQVNPGASMSVDSTKINGTDGESGALANIKYLTFPTGVSVFKVGATSYTSGTWPGGGLTVPLFTSIRITPDAGLVTPIILFKVIDNGGATSLDTGRISIPLYLPLTAGTIAGGGSAICGTGIPSAFTSSVAAANGRATIQYQWQVSTTSTSAGFADITDATSATFTPANAITQTSYYRRKVSTSVDAAIYSNVITITINALPSAPTSPVNGSRSGTGTVSLSATAVSGSTIDWYAASSGGSVLSSGTGTSSFTTPSINSTTTYFAESRNTTTGCVSATRTAVIATVTGTVNGGTISASQLICGTNIPDTMRSVTEASSGTAPYTYQWQSSTSSTFASGVVDLIDDGATVDGVASDVALYVPIQELIRKNNSENP